MFRFLRVLFLSSGCALGLLPITGQAIQRCTGADGHFTYTDLACPENSDGTPYKAHNPPPGSTVRPQRFALPEAERAVPQSHQQRKAHARSDSLPETRKKEASRKDTDGKRGKKKKKPVKYAPVLKRSDKKQEG